MDRANKPQGNRAVDFQCNICGTEVRNCPAEDIDRETVSCPVCCSTVRTRSIVYLLIKHLLGRGAALSEIETYPQIVGLGLSDGPSYSGRLAEKFSYTNTFFHTEPYFDICAPVRERESSCDFLISTEVFEHVVPPAQAAFQHAFDVLKPGGVLVLTVPFSNEPVTTEHFPDLHDYQIVRFGDEYVLVNRTVAGQYALHRDLVFHGGPGTTLEMRVFCREAIRQHLADAGFVDIEVFEDNVPEYGIVHHHPWSLPIVAKRPATVGRAADSDKRPDQVKPASSPEPRRPDALPSASPADRTLLTTILDIPTIAFVASVALTIFGLFNSSVLSELIWQPLLANQAAVLVAGVAAASVGACLIARRFHLKPEPALGLVLLTLIAALCGAAATLTVLLFLVSSGSLATIVLTRAGTRTNNQPLYLTVIVGWALFAVFFAILAPVPINTTATHGVLLLAPIVTALAIPSIRSQLLPRAASQFLSADCSPRPSPAYLAGLITCVAVLSLHVAMVAMPERYYDALVIHLYIPSYISAHRAWSYDAANFAFAYSPIGADMLYAHMYLLGGEAAARLLNFAAFVFTCLVTFGIGIRACSSRAAVVWAIALLVSIPLTFIESASLFVENTVTLFVAAAALALIIARFRPGTADYLAILITLAAASTVKLHGAIAAALLGGVAAVLYLRDWRRSPRLVPFVLITGAGALASLSPYLYSWVNTGNPVLPLFNHIFKSPFFPPIEFVDARWIGKFSGTFLYDVTFRSSDFVEGYNGALGFSFLVFLVAGVAAALVRRNIIALFCAGFGLFVVTALSMKTQYLRYLLIFFPFLIVAVACGLDHLRSVRAVRFPLAAVLVAVVLLNVFKMPAGGWILGVSDLRACYSPNIRRQLEIDQAPERVVNRIANEAGGPLARVLYISNPFGGLLTGTAIYTSWYNTAHAAEFATVASDEALAALIGKIKPTYVVLDRSGQTKLEKIAAGYLDSKSRLVTTVGRLALFQL